MLLSRKTEKSFCLLVLFAAIFCCTQVLFAVDVTKLASLHDANGKPSGVGAPFVGVINDKLIVAGGTNFPDEPLWLGGKKKFHDAIHILEKKKDGSFEWSETSVCLPAPCAHGASVTIGNTLYMIGGSDAETTHDTCWKMTWDRECNKPVLTSLPNLPTPLSLSAAAAYNNVIYVAGGFTDENAGTCSAAFYALDLGKSGTEHFHWETLPTWDGPARAMPVCAVQNCGDVKAFYMFGGRLITEAGELVEFGDAWCYRFDTKTWSPVENVDGIPFIFPGAAAIASGTTHILFFGNADTEAARSHDRLSEEAATAEKNGAENADELKRKRIESFENFPGFSDEIYAFNTITKKFFFLAKSPYPLPVVTPAVSWQGEIVFACGESGPGRRSSDVLGIQIQQSRSRLGAFNISVMVLYFGLLLGMGYFFAKRQKGTDDYFRGGHRVPWWIVGISLFGTSMSAISYMAVPAKSFMTNWNFMILAFAPLWASPVIIYFLIPNLRKYNLTSAYEYLEKRFHLVVRLLGSLVFMTFQVVRMAVMLFLPAIALNVVTNIDIYVCISVVGVVSLIYTLFGGIEAVIWTDVLQVVILMGGLVVALYLAVAHLDVGVMEAARLAAADHKTSLGNFSFNIKESTVWTVLIGSFFLYLIPFSSDQSLVQRYFVSKTDREAAGGLWVNAWLTFPCSVLLFALGTVLYLFFKANPTELSVVMNNNDSLFPWFIITQMPVGMSGLVIVAIFAASMSSLSASVNAISAAYTIDFQQRLFSKTKTASLFSAKCSTLVGGVFGITLALSMVTWDISSFWDEYNRLMGLITSGLAALFFLGVLSKRANAPGALIGLLTGILVQLYVSRNQSVHFLLYAGTGFVSCLVVGYLASWFFPPPNIVIPVKNGNMDAESKSFVAP